MSQLLSTDAIAPRERLAYWTDMICSTYVQLECDAPDAQGFGGSIQSHHLPGLDLSVVRSRAQRVVRTPRSISRAADDCFIVSLQTRGHGVISQDGRQATVAPGDFALYDSTRPYTLQFSEDFEEIVLKLRGEQLRALVAGTEQLTATTVSGQSGAGHLMAHMVTALRDEAQRLPAASAAAVASGVINVLAAGLQSLPACGHIDTRLRDPGLSIESVAADLGMSVGHLHRLFKTEPQSPSHYLWAQRLDGASRELLDARRARAAVSEIAFGWGFNDAAHFSRAFRERFQQSPREWRAQKPD